MHSVNIKRKVTKFSEDDKNLKEKDFKFDFFRMSLNLKKRAEQIKDSSTPWVIDIENLSFNLKNVRKFLQTVCSLKRCLDVSK